MVQDLRLAFRRLLAAPGFTTVAVATLALGIGANGALGGIIASVLVRPLPLPDADQLVAVRARNPKDGQLAPISGRDVEDWAAASRTMAAFGAWRDWSFSRTTPGGRERYYGIIATGDIFRVLALRPLLGRTFTADDDRPGATAVVVLTESAWRSRFAADSAVVGRTLTLSRAPRGDIAFTVIGVVPDPDVPSFDEVTFIAPAVVDDDAMRGRWLRNRRVWARMHPGVTLAEARAEMTMLAAQLSAAYPDSHGGWTVDVQPLARAEVGSMRPRLLFFGAAVGFVLLIACANVAGLLIARASGREREFAVRAALGGRAGHIVKLVLAEAAVLGMVAGVLSLLVQLWLLDTILAMGPAIPRFASVPIGVTIGLTIALSAVASALLGLLPAWQAARVGIGAAIRRGGARGASAGGQRARSWLVGLQVALALMLLAGAAVSLRALARLLGPPAGFDPHGVIVTQIYPSTTKYATPAALAQLVPAILADARGIPGVQAVATVSAGPLFGGTEPVELETDAAAPAPGATYPTARFFDASPGYFAAIGATLDDGRDFTDRDIAGAPRVAVVNQAFARRFWRGERAVGRRIRLARGGADLEVVGVVRDFAKDTTGMPAEPEIYWPYLQSPRWAFYLVARASTPESVVPALRSRLASIDPDLVPARVSSLDELIVRATRGERFGAFVMGLFAACALLLAALGTYGLVSYAAAQRTREIGIRISFGAAPADIRRLVLRTGLGPIVAGTLAGGAGAFAASRLLASAIGDIGSPDGVTLTVAAGLLLATATIASLIPARRATRVDPLTALGTVD
jgi:predicted permease